ncbi:MAG: carnitine dehydratase [Peptococcaceae bacterium]|jgi:CoA:oxalate CoA-transferase|nr:carnitine dehydratase [Peptococcaceae bacterium]
MSNTKKLPLAGVKVLDMTRVLAGPFATMMLADFGAEVIKIERPEVGDDSREFGPFVDGFSAYFASLNRGKQSLTLELKTPEGKAVFLDLVKKVDVLVENFRPGTMEKLGLGYEELKKVNPRLIYAASSGFGRTGPYAHKAAYDMIVQGMGGIMSITGEPGRPPVRVGASIGDITAGLFTAYGIMTALYHREKTGLGQLVDVAMLDCQVAILENAIARYAVTGKAPEPLGTRHPSITPFQAYKTQDDWIIVAVGNDQLWAKFCKVIGREELIDDSRFITNAKRTEHVEELGNILEEIFKTKSFAQWMKELDAAGIPCGPINTVDKLFNHPQINSREMLVKVKIPQDKEIVAPGVPVKLSETPGGVQGPAPALGEHTDEILKTLLGYTEEKIASLKTKGAL